MRRLLILMCLILPSLAFAHDADKDGIHIADPWIKTPIGLGKVAAGYLSIIDFGGDGDTLIGVRSDIAHRTELHTHRHENGVMRMRPVDSIAINPMGAADLVPGGEHVMLMGLTRKLKAGDKITLTLVFQKVGEIEVPVTVRNSAPE